MIGLLVRSGERRVATAGDCTDRCVCHDGSAASPVDRASTPECARCMPQRCEEQTADEERTKDRMCLVRDYPLLSGIYPRLPAEARSVFGERRRDIPGCLFRAVLSPTSR